MSVRGAAYDDDVPPKGWIAPLSAASKIRASKKLEGTLPKDVDSSIKMMVGLMNSPKRGIKTITIRRGFRKQQFVFSGESAVDWFFAQKFNFKDRLSAKKVCKLIHSLGYLEEISGNKDSEIFADDSKNYYRLAPIYMNDTHLNKQIIIAIDCLCRHLKIPPESYTYSAQVIPTQKAPHAKSLDPTSQKIYNSLSAENVPVRSTTTASRMWNPAGIKKKRRGKTRNFLSMRGERMLHVAKQAHEREAKRRLIAKITYPVRAIVSKQYSAVDLDDEISLQLGEEIEVHDCDSSGWWTGRSLDGFGLFPYTHVKLQLELPPQEIVEEDHQQLGKADEVNQVEEVVDVPRGNETVRYLFANIMEGY